MSRQDRLVTDKEALIKIIDRCQVLHIGMHDGDDIYVIPMNYGYTWENEELTFYLHGALEGKKVRLLRENKRVGFSIDCDHLLVEGKLPCQFAFQFASVAGTGEAEFIEDSAEKISAMEHLMRQYSDRKFEFNERLVSIVSVIRVRVKAFTGRVRK